MVLFNFGLYVHGPVALVLGVTAAGDNQLDGARATWRVQSEAGPANM
jgi:hypothetical protein